MVELAAPSNFAAGEPQVEVIAIDEFTVGAPNSYAVFYETAVGPLWRLRYLNLNGRLSGTVGTNYLSLVCITSILTPPPWSGAQPIVAGSGDALTRIEFDLTWSTEVGTNYSGYGSNEGNIRQMGIPLVWMYGRTTFSLSNASLDGGDSQGFFIFGQMMIEYVPQGTVGTGGDSGQALYLLGGSG